MEVNTNVGCVPLKKNYFNILHQLKKKNPSILKKLEDFSVCLVQHVVLFFLYDTTRNLRIFF